MNDNPSRADVDSFYGRLTRIYDSWDELIRADSILVPVGKLDSNIEFCKSLSIQQWLFGRLIPELIVLISRRNIIFYAPILVINSLQNFRDRRPQETTVPRIELVVRDDTGTNLSRVLDVLKSNGKIVGNFPEDKFDGTFYQDSIKSIFREENGFERNDISAGIACIFAVKDEIELECMRKAGRVSRKAAKCVLDEFYGIGLEEDRASHKEISEDYEWAICEDIENFSEHLQDIDQSRVDVCFTPIIQSGGNFNMNIDAPSNESIVNPNSAMLRLGVRFGGYCADIGRTFLYHASKTKLRHARFVSSLLVYLRLNLYDGVVLSELYKRTISYARRLKPNLVDNLTPDFGYAIGLEPREDHLVIGPNSLFTAKRNMTFVIRVGLNNLEDPTAIYSRSKYYALFQSDTYVINDKGIEATSFTGDQFNDLSTFDCIY